MGDFRSNDSGDEPGEGKDRASPPSTPRWVKVSGIIVAVVIVALVIFALATGEHGPSRHQPGDDNPRGYTPFVQHIL